MKISEKDVNEFLEFRRRFTELEWTTMNNYIEFVLTRRRRNFILTSSEVEEVRNLIREDKFI